MDSYEPGCCFDASAYTGTPDAEPTGETMPVRELIAQLDALYNAGKEDEAGAFLEQWRNRALSLGDWRGQLSLTSELMGHWRRSMNAEKGLQAVEQGLALIREHRLGGTVSGTTVMLNAATTLKCFGRAADSLPIFEHVSRVYQSHLDPADYRFAGLYNNMALSYQDVENYAAAERCFLLAKQGISRLGAFNELAVTCCNLAELYDRQNPEDERVSACMEQAWAALNTPGLAHDGYHAFTLSKCLPSFDYFGYFLYAAELKRRMETIYAGA